MNYLLTTDEYLSEYRLITLMLGILFLLAGATFSGLPDWDAPVSLLMALCAFLTAAPSLRVVFERRWAHAHYAAFWTWFSVDGSYLTYWGFVNPAALELRWANASASLALYLMCGLVWYVRTPTYRAQKTLSH